jgi:hypothetical protein
MGIDGLTRKLLNINRGINSVWKNLLRKIIRDDAKWFCLLMW